MKNGLILVVMLILSMFNITYAKVISNEKIDKTKVETANKIIADLQTDMKVFTNDGSGPFAAAIYDNDGNLIIKVANSVVNEHCSNNHAENECHKSRKGKIRNLRPCSVQFKIIYNS